MNTREHHAYLHFDPLVVTINVNVKIKNDADLARIAKELPSLDKETADLTDTIEKNQP